MRKRGSAGEGAIGPAFDRVLDSVDALLLDLDGTWARERPPRRTIYRRARHLLHAHRAATNMLVLIVFCGIVIGWLVSHAGS